MNFEIQPIQHALEAKLTQKINHKTKPLGALGQLERIALQIGLIQETLTPQIMRPTMLVFAADHGIAAASVSAYPQAVTAQMVLNFINGGAAINVFCRQHDMVLRVVDAGVNYRFSSHPKLIDAKIAMGTQNFLWVPAMTISQCEDAIKKGMELAQAEIAQGSNLLGVGEMGIGNTSSASCLMSLLCDLPIESCVGRGTGLNDASVLKKISILRDAIAVHQVSPTNVRQVLATFGGFEIAMMVGAMLGAAQQKAVILIDGFIATAALLVAVKISPTILDYCIFSHCSDESGHARMLQFLGVEPLLRMSLRLGEGSGAALALPLVQSAVSFLNEMASFESAGVSEKC